MILNLTQHNATPEQREAGVVEPHDKELVRKGLTFERIPSLATIVHRAGALARMAKDHGVSYAMIGGAPYLMAPLEEALIAEGIKPVYSFTQREVVEVHTKDGGVEKKSIFRHVGFVGL